MQSNIISKPALNRHSTRHFYVSEKKSPKELLSPQIIFFFIEGSPVDDPTVLQNRSTMGVQIPSTFPKSLDFKPFQPKVRVLPWQMKSTRILIKTPFKMRCPAAICSDLRDVNSSLCIGHFCTKNAKLSKILQDVYSNRSRNGVKG